MLKAVIFDMDGVIVNSEPFHRKAFQNVFDDLNIKVSNSLYESYTGQTTLAVCKHLCKHFKLKKTPEELVILKDYYFDFLFDNDKNFNLIEGVLDLIQEFHKHGLKLVLASSSSMAEINQIFSRFNLDKFFVAKISGTELKASKPHPEIFINAANVSGFSKSECIVIEDSKNGIKAANAASIFCIGYTGNHANKKNYLTADMVITSFKEISYNSLKNVLGK